MPTSHEQLVQEFFKSYCDTVSVPSSPGRAFVQYVSHLLIQRGQFEASDEQLMDGITDGALDGGIDAVYTIFNNEPLEPDSDIVLGELPSAAKQGHGELEVVVVQTKMHGMGTTAVEKLIANLPRLMNLSPATDLSSNEFNDAVLERFDIARAAWSALAVRGVRLKFRVALGTMSDLTPLSSETAAKIGELRRTLEELAAVSSVSVDLEMAPQLIQRHRLLPPENFTLPYQRSLASGSGTITLVKLSDYAAFVDDGTGRVRLSLLDENVRDYQGQVAVNQAISDTLASPSGTPFWWLNNGITLICQVATTVGEAVHMTAPKVVNGLQTTRVIHDYLAKNPGADARDQLVQVRILTTSDDNQRDGVTRSTNSQTSVDSASLRATDSVQKDIESYFAARGFYYDRRKGSFREQQAKGEVVVSIRDLGQALTAVVLARPDEARGKPSSLLKDDQRYSQIFNSTVSLDLYLFMVRLDERVGAALITPSAAVSGVQRRYLKLHVLTAVVAAKLGYWSTGASRLSGLLTTWMPSDEEVVAALRVVQASLRIFTSSSFSSLEKATKVQGFTTTLAAVGWADVSAWLAEIETEESSAEDLEGEYVDSGFDEFN